MSATGARITPWPDRRRPARVLSRRQLNRATLDRQLLLTRSSTPVVEAVEHLLGLQAQVPLVPYTTLWSRLDDFRPGPARRPAARPHPGAGVADALDRAPGQRRRRPGPAPRMHVVMARSFGSTAWARTLREQGADVGAILDAGREILEQGRTAAPSWARQLAGRFPDLDVESMGVAVTLPCAHRAGHPARAVGRARAGEVDHDVRMARRLRDPEPIDLRDLVVRYLRAFGPASVKDLQAWCYLTRLREVTDAARSTGCVATAPRRAPSCSTWPMPPFPTRTSPAPVRFLGEYDNAALGYADRRRFSADGDHVWLSGGPGGAIGNVLVDGLGRATWALRRAGPKARARGAPVGAPHQAAAGRGRAGSPPAARLRRLRRRPRDLVERLRSGEVGGVVRVRTTARPPGPSSP